MVTSARPVDSTAASTNFVGALGTGSGIDIKALATNLVAAEKAPQEAQIQGRIDQTEARIKGYSAVRYAVEQVQVALEALQDPSAFNTTTASSSAPNALGVKVLGAGQPGSHAVTVQQLATAQRVVSTAALSANTAVADAPYDITLVSGTSQATVRVTGSGPQALVDAINGAQFAGITARMLDEGTSAASLRIVLQGATGASQAFHLESTALEGRNTGLLASDASQSTSNRSARDALLTVDGITLRRPSNQISDVIPGVELSLARPTVADLVPETTITLQRDTAPVKQKIEQLVANYNDLQAILDAAADPESSVDVLGGSLAGDPAVRAVRDQVRRILLPDVQQLGGAQAPLSDLRQLGLFVDSDQRLKFVTVQAGGTDFASTYQIGNSGQLDTALAQRFDEVSRFFSGPQGIARDRAQQLAGTGSHVDTSMRPRSPIRLLSVQASNAQNRVQTDQDRLAALEERMKGLLDRYLRQFAIMDTLVGQSKSLQSSVENSFKGMSASRG